MKVLVTGGGGFVGNVLVRKLLGRGIKVKVLDNFTKSCDALIGLVPNKNFEFVYGDVTNYDDCEKACEGVDGIIHLAAIVGFPDCKAHPATAKAVNVGGTENMLEARDHVVPGVPFVFASTGSVYGKVEGICNEESPLNAVSLYGITKYQAEKMVREAENTVSFRFATGFGLSPNLRVNLLVNDFVYQAYKNHCLVVFQADFRRTFIHVQDMAKTLMMGMNKLAYPSLGTDSILQHKVYNAGANHLNWTKRELAEYVSEKTGCLVHYAEIGQDEDQRDYEVDYRKWELEGFLPNYTIQEGIDELIKAAPLVRIVHQYE